MAASALVEEGAGICRHLQRFFVPAVGAAQYGAEQDLGHAGIYVRSIAFGSIRNAMPMPSPFGVGLERPRGSPKATGRGSGHNVAARGDGSSTPSDELPRPKRFGPCSRRPRLEAFRSCYR